MATQKNRQEIIDALSKCGILSYQDMVNLLYSIAFLNEIDTGSFDGFISRFTGEWDEDKSQKGKYDNDYYAVKESVIYKSVVDNNTSIPGASNTWVPISSQGASVSQFNPTQVANGGTLPSSTTPMWMFLSPGTYTKPEGGTLTVSGQINVVATNGLVYKSLIETSINLSSYLLKTEYRYGGKFATTAAANLAITNTLVNGVNRRDGTIVDIGTSNSYVPYTWKGGTLDRHLVEYFGALAKKIDLDYLAPVTTNINLVNTLDPLYKPNFYMVGGVVTAAAPGWYVSGFIPVKPNTAYTPNYKSFLDWFDETQTYISESSSSRTDLFGTAPANARYLRFGGVNPVLKLVEGAYSSFPANVPEFEYMLADKNGAPVNAKYISQSLKDELALKMDIKDTVIKNLLSNQISDLYNQLDVMSESKQALFIDMQSFTKGFSTYQNVDVVLPATGTSGSNQLTVSDITLWGTVQSELPVVVKYSTGRYGTFLVLSISGNVLTLDDNLEQSAASVSGMHNLALGQHLSNYGYNAMAERLFYHDKRTAFRYANTKWIRMENVTRKSSTVILLDKTTQAVVADFYTIGGAVSGGNTSTGMIKTIDVLNEYRYSTFSRFVYGIAMGDAAGKGVALNLDLNYKGYLELYLGTDKDVAGTGKVEFLENGVVTFSRIFYGSVKRITIPFSGVTSVLQITTATAFDTKIKIGDIMMWRKREVTGSLFSSTDRVTFFTDSWGVFPGGAATPKVALYDGTLSDNQHFLPIHFREVFSTIGGDPNKVFLATRGGQTSAWAKYWIDKIIADTQPTKIVLHFSINDQNSATNVPNMTSSVYDFDPVNIWGTKRFDAGGVFGSTTQQQWFDNMKYICDRCISKGVIPIVMMPPRTASIAQSLPLSTYNTLLLGGFPS